MIREWKEEMGQISGFGGSYEDGCRAMVLAGIHWIDEHPDAELTFSGFKGVFGLIQETNDEAKQFTEAMMNARVMMDGREVRCGDEATGAMHHAAVMHCFAYKKHGWDEYCKQLQERELKEKEDK